MKYAGTGGLAYIKTDSFREKLSPIFPIISAEKLLYRIKPVKSRKLSSIFPASKQAFRAIGWIERNKGLTDAPVINKVL